MIGSSSIQSIAICPSASMWESQVGVPCCSEAPVMPSLWTGIPPITEAPNLPGFMLRVKGTAPEMGTENSLMS